MSGIAARFTKVLLLAAVALAVTASSGAAASRPHGQISGVVPHNGRPLLTPHLLSRAVIRTAGPTTLTFDAKYQNVINQYFTDVAHDSGGANNVYSVATQYSDGTGAIQYQSTVGGAYVSHDPLPASGCDDGLDAYCLTDQQLETEIQNVLTAKGWHGGLNHIFFLMTPNGVGSCFDSSSIDCSTNAFCAYHSYFTNSSSESVIYANEPYEGPYPGCTDATQGFPSDIDADTTVNTISHEHNEAITDPLTDPANEAWIATDGSENGDLCAYGFGAAIGTAPNGQPYNQLINNRPYSLQEEWSNPPRADTGCIQRPNDPNPQPAQFGSPPLVNNGGPVMHTNTTYAIYWLPTARNTSAPAVTGTPVVNSTLHSSAGVWAGGATSESFQWQRCSSTGTSCADIAGATTSSYKLTTADGGHVVRSTVRATNVNGASSPAASAGSPAVVDIPTATKAPHISGKARVGKKLSGSHGSWTFAPMSYKLQWLRCNSHGAGCSSIGHATHTTYKLTSRDAGHRLRLRVTATNAAGSTAATSPTSTRVTR
ncbi:MAG TPA: hypothetical protein VF124_00375 [Gaiellaceae bacterium]